MSRPLLGWEIFTTTLLQFALWAFLALPAISGTGNQGKIFALSASASPAAAAAAQSQKQTTRNPHGPALTIPCENCHTAAAWRPIRAVPEFDHNKTKYPLRGMHEKVDCIQCHVKPVFTNVGKNCADCHQDVHRRQMGPNCEQCHTVQGWDIAVQQVKDHMNRFPLLGAHAAVPCEECHRQAATGIFYGLSTECQSCHLKDWQKTTNPPHASAGPAFAAANCQQCHTNFDSWLGATFNHSVTGFILDGAHATLACTACHINNNFNLQNISNQDCGNSGCHLTTWQQTNNPAHATNPQAFPIAQCSTCHNTTSWTTTTFNHANTGFPLTNAHASPPLACTACHINNNYSLQIAPTDCGNPGCHLTTWQQANNPNHQTSGAAFAAANCAQCHDTIAWTDLGSFNHAVTGFTLTGMHVSPSPTPCVSCHVNNNYALTIQPTDCGNSSCHLTQWNSTQTMGGNVPNHVTAGFPISQCSSCHNTTSWANATFNHATTGFPLTNAHASPPLQCAQCHINNNYNLQIAPTDCGNAGCHLTTWQQTNNPNHQTAGSAFAAANCAQCHDTIAWTDMTSFNHAVTGFTLTGMHVSPSPTPCVSCHVGNNYTLTIQPTDCGNSACHLTQWNSTQTLGGNVPNHITAGFPISQCSSCHDTTNWADATFNHATTGFPLTNSHQMAPAGKVTACAQCHINNNYNLQIAPTDCGNAGCHLTTWQQTNNPNHQTAGSAFAAANCSTCHDTLTWTDNTFNHSVTGFTLTGMHVSPTPTPCVSCHVGNNYTLTIQPTDCGNSACHLTQWNSTQTLGGNVPNHITAGFPIAQCSTCHDTTNWADSIFNHSTTGFALTGQHAVPPLTCAQCHINGNYSLTTAASDCANAGCHLTDWTNTNNPVHSAAGTTFAAANCSNCHSTSAPFTTTSWSHSSTNWPLTGNHQMAPAGAATNCNQCHVGNNYNLTTGDCWNSGCHTADWNSTASLGGAVPNHVAAQFPTSMCATCHDTVLWADGKFDHSTTGWALTGGHVVPTAGGVQSCTQCHVGNNYSLTSANTVCYGCHVAEWNSTQTLGGSVPNHIAAGYPTTCDTCHTTTNWLGAVFNHTYFPIPHHGSVCNDCHQVSTDYTSFTCINCHTTTAHQQTQTDNEHQGVGGYTYGPETCYNCHKNGGGG